MKFKIFFILLFIVMFLAVSLTFSQKVNKTEVPRKVLSSENKTINLKNFEIHSLTVGPLLDKTQIFIPSSPNPILSIDGFFYNARFIQLNPRNKTEIFVIEVNGGGKLLNSLLYQFRDNKLIEIPIKTGSPLTSIWSSGGTEFKDINNDGILEMLVYHRLYPPEKKRTVEVYKFNEKVFEKYQDYEEITSMIYY